MKYIDAELLRKEIERRRLQNRYIDTDGYEQELFEIIDSLQQEQPFGDLEKEIGIEKFTDKIETFQARYKYPENISIKGAMAFMARMFYQYPNTARKWYEQLPKVTMD